MRRYLDMDSKEFKDAPYRFTYKAGKRILRATIEIPPCIFDLALYGERICRRTVSLTIVRTLQEAHPQHFRASSISWNRVKWAI